MGYPFDKTWEERIVHACSVQEIVEKLPHTILGSFNIYRTTKLYESPAAPPTPGNITWDNTIKDYFTEKDKGCMSSKFDLGSHDDVALHAQEIYEATSSHQMPLHETKWTAEMITNFQTWMNEDPRCP